jgi:hypothetical protein
MSGKPIEITKTIGKQKFSRSKYSTTSHIELYNADYFLVAESRSRTK